MSPEISIIVPVYNSAKYVEKCVRSLFSQTFGPIEFCFIDDCSDDNSIPLIHKVLDKFPDRKASCVFIRNDKNLGVASSRNIGLDIAKGKYIYFCDSDDYIDETMMEKMYLKAESSSADVVLCDYYFSYPDSEEYHSVSEWSQDKVTSLKKYMISPWTMLWNILVKRDIYETNEIRFIPGKNFCEDFNVTVKVLYSAGKVVNVHEALYHYNQFNPKSAVKSYDDKSFDDEQSMYLDAIEWFKSKNAYSDYSRELCWRILKILQKYVLESRYTEFRSFYPEISQYIWSCPYLNHKLKIMMWSLFHHLGFIARFMITIRNLKSSVMKSARS